MTAGLNDEQSPKSCGNTMQAFASLFLDQTQIHAGYLDYVTNGSPSTMFWHNPNILLSVVKSGLSSVPTHYDFCCKHISHLSSRRGHRDIEKILTTQDSEEQLPRILFCKLAWVDYDVQSGERTISDHSFTLVKHTNFHFRLVQGYVSSPDAAASFAGFDSKSFQQSGNVYSSKDGFHLKEMNCFLKHLQCFSTSVSFDAIGYAHMFGVMHTGGTSSGFGVAPAPVRPAVASSAGVIGQPPEGERGRDKDKVVSRQCNYWPSLYHVELMDSSIIGYGSRDMAEAIDVLLAR
jgi:hypothetical protein